MYTYGEVIYSFGYNRYPDDVVDVGSGCVMCQWMKNNENV